MTCKLLHACIVLLSLTKLSHAIPIDEFYPFGGSHGDSDFPKNDDGSSPPVTISTLFPFFNNQHDSLFVNTNGVISFLGAMSQYTPGVFPLSNDRRLVAPFWADVDITRGGTVWYRETTNTSILERATDDVRLFYPGQSNFVAAWVFIATWDDVAFYGASTAIAAKKRNSFQAVLITNGRHSFTILNYYNITWTTGTASGGNAEGLGGTPAQVGFNAGDGINYYAVNESRTDAIINLPRLSNVHVDGKFVFRVDTETIEQGGCNTGGTLTISPRYSHMLGGEEKVLAGPCIQSNDSVTAVFGIGGTPINCIMHSMFSVTCVTPSFYTTGDVSVILTVTSANQQSSIYEGKITILNPLNKKPVLQRLDPSNWKRGEQVTVKWSAADIPFDIEGSTMDIYTVKLDSSDHIPRIQYHSSVVQYITSIQTEVTFTFESEDDAILLSLVEVTQDNDQNPKQRVWSDAFVVIPRNINESKTSCDRWQTTDDQLPPLSAIQVQVCPCRLAQVEIDLIRFHPDPVCQSQDSSLQQDSHTSVNCLLHPHAKQCFRLNTPGPIGTGQLCCYDNDGNVMSMLTSSGGGSLQRFHYFGDTDGVVPYLSNFVFDTAPYYHCCVYPQLIQWGISSECFGFYQRRTPGNCNDYVPNTPAQNVGDPHFMTPDGLSYTFNGAGEFTLFRTITNNFIAQVRMQPLENNGNQGSVITSFAAEAVNASDRVEVRLNSIRAFDILVNGVIQDITGVPFLRYKGVTISVRDNSSTTNGHKKEVNLAFPEQEIAFQTLVYESFLNYIVSFGPSVKRGAIEGLLGNFNQDPNDDLVSQTGDVLPANSSTEYIHNNMGESWRITEEESLFTYAVGTSYASIQDRTFSPLFDVPVSAVDNATRELCGDDTFCYYDYYVTGDTTLARSTRTSAQTLTRIQEISRKTITCGFPLAVEYGQWNVSGIEVGDTGKLICNSDAQLQGPGYTTCSTEGHWTGSHSSCAPTSIVITATVDPDTDMSESGSWLLPVVIGIASVFVLIIIFVVFIVLARCFCCRNSKAKGRGDREYPKSAQEYDNTMYRSTYY